MQRAGLAGVTVTRWIRATTVVGIMLSSGYAEADTCKTWRADVIDSRTGKKSGEVLSTKDDLASIQRASINAVKTAAYLCGSIGPQDSDCFTKVSAPYCGDAASKPSPARSFTVRVDRRCITSSGLVMGSILVNGELMGDVAENAKRLIAAGIYGGHLRSWTGQKDAAGNYIPGHENLQGDFGTMGHTGGDFLLEVDGVQCANGRPRTGLEFHGGTKPTDSTGCVLLGPTNRRNSIRSIPDIDTNLLARLRTEFYGSKLPDATPDREIQFEFGQPDDLPECK